MKAFSLFSLLGLLATTSVAAPSYSEKKDGNIFLYDPTPEHVVSAGPGAQGHLIPGDYLITSPSIRENNLYIGRSYREDLSLNPKRVGVVDSSANVKVRRLLGFHRFGAHVFAVECRANWKWQI